MRRPLLAALAVLLCNCVPLVGLTRASLKDQENFHVVQLSPGGSYLIDPRTETCVLIYGTPPTVAATVSCAKLKRSVPEAADFITWE